MTSPEATPEDVQEQRAALVDEPDGVAEDLPTEASEADVAEQHTGLGAGRDEEGVPDEASEADVQEQRAEVGYDEDDAPIG